MFFSFIWFFCVTKYLYVGSFLSIILIYSFYLTVQIFPPSFLSSPFLPFSFLASLPPSLPPFLSPPPLNSSFPSFIIISSLFSVRAIPCSAEPFLFFLVLSNLLLYFFYLATISFCYNSGFWKKIEFTLDA